jgi:hypothetical protein
LINSGIIETASTATDSQIFSQVTNNGTIQVNDSYLGISGSVNGAGAAIINGGNLEFGADVSAGQTVTFSKSNGQLILQDAPQFAGTLAGFGLGENIDLMDINFNSVQFKFTYTPNGGNTGGVLMVTDGTNTADINFVGSYSQSNFHAQADTSGTLITDPRVSQLAQAMASMGGGSSTDSRWSQSSGSPEFARYLCWRGTRRPNEPPLRLDGGERN